MNSFITPPCITAYIIHRTPQGPKYLLIRRACGGYLNGTWQMVTGGSGEGETASQTALREINEETGLIPSKLYNADAVETFFLHARNRMLLVPVFVAFVESTDVKLCPEEHDAYEWLTYEEATTRLVWTEQKRILADIHERFGSMEPNPMLLIQDSAPVAKSTVSRTSVFAIAMENQKMLLVKQYKGCHAGKWDLPGGGIEAGETIEQALKREFREEVGMTFETMQQFANLTAFTEIANAPNLYQIGLVYQVSGHSLLNGSVPEMEYAWLNPEELDPKTLSPFVAQVIIDNYIFNN